VFVCMHIKTTLAVNSRKLQFDDNVEKVGKECNCHVVIHSV
jgi:hypothetical protein